MMTDAGKINPDYKYNRNAVAVWPSCHVCKESSLEYIYIAHSSKIKLLGASCVRESKSAKGLSNIKIVHLCSSVQRLHLHSVHVISAQIIPSNGYKY